MHQSLPLASEAHTADRVVFLKRTYSTLFLAIIAFMALEVIFYKVGLSALLFSFVAKIGNVGWLGVLALFGAVAVFSDKLAHGRSESSQMMGISFYVIAEALIFAPMIYLAVTHFPKAIPSASIVTLSIFGGLTGYVLVTKKDFSFLKGALTVASMAALAYILIGAVFGYAFYTIFVVGMIVLASGFILFQTSKVVREYHLDQHIGAATGLFAALALMFWYVLQLFMQE